MAAPDKGFIRFYATCRPPLTAGEYQIEIDQTLLRGDATSVDAANSLAPRVQEFEVTGPRFTLNPAELHAAYPPPNSRGRFSSRLPMVALRRRTLPWERTIDGSVPGPTSTAPPWLALLLFEEGEVRLLDPPECTIGSIVRGDILRNVVSISLPAPAPTLAQPCLGAEVEMATFKQVAPMQSELELLVHVRQVNTADKELLGMDLDGWFAVVVGNRLPEPRKKYVACLVSLEGYGAHLPTAADTVEYTAADFAADEAAARAAAIPTATNVTLRDGIGRGLGTVPIASAPAGTGVIGTTTAGPVTTTRPTMVAATPVVEATATIQRPPQKIRLITLARWGFTCEGGSDFETVMKTLPAKGAVAMLGNTPPGASLPGRPSRARRPVAVESGHVPLAHTTRAGERTTTWYRGPFVPTGVTQDLLGPYHTADQARRVDPQTGMENVGYAAAFEIGRLLALSDPRFALDLLRWRRGDYQRVTQVVLQRNFVSRLPEFLAQFDWLAHLGMVANMLGFLGDGILVKKWLGPLGDPTGIERMRSTLPGLDPLAVARATQFPQSSIEALFGASLDVVRGFDLDSLGVKANSIAGGDLTTLGPIAVTEFGHLEDQRRTTLLLAQSGGV